VVLNLIKRAPRGDLAGSVGVFVLSLIVAVMVLRVWRADLHVPFQYFGDNMLNLALVRDVIDHGWFLSNPDLGFPSGQDLADYGAPSGDNLTFLLIRALAVFTSSPGLIVNLVYLLSFPVVAVVAFLVLRHFGISAVVAAVCATLFTLVPYHFLRTEGHLFLAFYYAVPLGVYLALSVLGGRALFRRRAGAGSRWAAWASRKSAATLAICAVVGSGGIYYGVFALILLVAALLMAMLTRQGRSTVISAIVVIAAILAVIVINIAPSIIYHLQHGTNEFIAARQSFESELYSLKFMDLVLPVVGHPIEFLNQFQVRYHQTTPLLSEPTGALGIVGTVGFIWLLAVALAALMGRSLLTRAQGAGDERERHVAFLALVAFLVGTTGGVSAFIAYTLTPQIRGWSRISIVIAFLALFAAAILLDRLRTRLEGSGGGRVLALGILGAVLLVGMGDQTNRTYVPNYAAAKAEFYSDAALAKQIDAAMPPGAAIMQLPYVPFPENPGVGALLDYDMLRSYVQGGGLRWSYGAIKGRPDDWQDAFFGVTPEQVRDGAVRGPLDNGRSPQQNVAALVSAGFDGVYVDRFGYGGGVGAQELALRRIVGRPPLVSPNGRMAFYSLLPYETGLRTLYPAKRLQAVGTATVKPLEATLSSGFYPLETAKTETWRWAQRSAELDIANPASTRRIQRLTATIETAGRATVTFRLPDGSVVRRRVGNGREKARITLDIPVRPGANTVWISTDAARVPAAPNDARLLFMRFIDSAFSEPAAALPKLPAGPPA